MTCPACRKEFAFADTGVDGLPKNFFIEQLKDFSGASNKCCNGSRDNGTGATLGRRAVRFCVECEQRLCDSCVELHRRSRTTSEHKLIEYRHNGNARNASGEKKTIFCDKHPSKAIEVYCTVCKEAICIMCFVKSHQSHACSDVDEVAHEFRQHLTNDVKKMNDVIEKCLDELKEQRKKKEDFGKAVEAIEKEICSRAEQLKNVIETEKIKLLHELKSRNAERSKQIEHVAENVEQRVSFVEFVVEYAEELRDKGTASDVAQQARTLHDRVDELTNIDDILREISALGSLTVSFETVKLPGDATGCLIGHTNWQSVKGKLFARVLAEDVFACVSPCISLYCLLKSDNSLFRCPSLPQNPTFRNRSGSVNLVSHLVHLFPCRIQVRHNSNC